MTATTGGSAQANFNSAFTLWSTSGYSDPALATSSGHTYSQVSTFSVTGWLTSSLEAGVTGFVGYANSGTSNWINGNSKLVKDGTELSNVGFVNSVTVGNHNAELRTRILPAGQYLLVSGGSSACGSFLTNKLAACPAPGVGNYSLTIDQVAATPLRVFEDSNGDYKSDIFWRHSTLGDNYLYYMDSAAYKPAYISTIADTAWQVKGRGDFNGDGKADVVLRNSRTGEAFIYLMNGAAVVSSASIGIQPLTADIKGSADYNGDGKSDVLWRNGSSGSYTVNLMNGLTVTATNTIGTEPLSADIKSSGDYNGDGRAEILWRDSASCNVYVKLLTSGAAIASTNTLVTGLASVWETKGSGDYNGDGTADILWRNSNTGENYLTLMKNGTVSSTNYINTVADKAWQVMGNGDYNGDGKADIFWMNASTGETYLSLMNGSAITSISAVTKNYDKDWQIAYTQ